ncbi:MAG: hypothetical protein JSS20_00705 [Proteobacteria bacterium]|nr:hypothetical protein [Pseudomonadota bacterium]
MRRRRSQWRSFLNGVVLATVPVVAFVATDYLLAPPSGGSGDTVSARQATAETAEPSRVEKFASRAVDTAKDEPSAAVPARIVPPAPQPAVRPARAESTAPRNTLVAGIQEELTRVGCYSGAQDGVWNEQTKAAMVAFNGSVHVNLPTEKPDYILLTLLQGHSAKACAEKAIEARVTPMVKPPQTAEASGRRAAPTWTTTVVEPKTAAPKLATHPALPAAAIASAPAMPAQAPATVAAHAPRYNEPASPPLASSPAVAEATGGESLSGRMSVGVMAPATPHVAPITAEPHAQAPSRSKTAWTSNSRPGNSGNWRTRTFSDLSRNAP